jgi:hypothetical protein
VLRAQGKGVAEAVRLIGVREVTGLWLGQGVWRSEDRPGETPQRAWIREPAAQKGSCRSDTGQADPEGGSKGKLLSPARRRICAEHVRGVLKLPERRVCRVLGQHRSTQRQVPQGRDDEEQLTADLIELAQQYGRYG